MFLAIRWGKNLFAHWGKYLPAQMPWVAVGAACVGVLVAIILLGSTASSVSDPSLSPSTTPPPT